MQPPHIVLAQMHHSTDWVGVAGLGVGIVALVFAIWQWRAQGDRASAIERALSKQKLRASAASLLATATQMLGTERDLRQAILANKRGDAEQALHQWKELAITAQSHAHLANITDPNLERTLEMALGSLDNAFADVVQHGANSIVRTAVPRISAANIQAVFQANVIMMRET